MPSNPPDKNTEHIINLCIILTLGYAFSGNFFWIQLEKTHNIRMTLFLYTIWTALSLGVSYVHIGLTNLGLPELKRVEKNLKNLGIIFTLGAYVFAGISIWLQIRSTHNIKMTLLLYTLWTALSLGISYIHINLSAKASRKPPHLPSQMSPPALLALYNRTWLSLPPHSQSYPFPNPLLSPSGFYNPSLNLSPAQSIILETQIFFLQGYEISFTFCTAGERIVILADNDVGKVKELEKFLRRKELPRWHPDWFGRRTGVEGRRDERLGKVPGIVAIRTGLQELVGVCGEFLLREGR